LLVLDPGGVQDDGTVESGDWSLRIDSLDQGVYTFDAFVIDEGANVTRSAPASGDTTPSLILLDGNSGDGGATEFTLNLTEGDKASEVSDSASLLVVDLGSGDTVTASSFTATASNDPLSLVGSLSDYITLNTRSDGAEEPIMIPNGQLLDSESNLASLQWVFSGDAAAFDALGSGDTFTAVYTLVGKDSDDNLSNEARLTVNIAGTNDAAVISGDITASTDETDEVVILTGSLTSTDVDNPDNVFEETLLSGDLGQLSLTASGDWTFIAADAFDALSIGESQTDVFTIETVDGTRKTLPSPLLAPMMLQRLPATQRLPPTRLMPRLH